MGVHVVHHKRDVLLRVTIHAGPFRNAPADELVAAFRRPLLVRGRGVAVEDPGPRRPSLPALQRGRIREFGPVVREDDRDEAAEGVMAKPEVYRIDDVNDRLRVVVVPYEGEHELGLDEMDRQEHLAPLLPLDGVQLGDGQPGVLPDELEVVPVSPARPAAPVHFQVLPGLPAGTGCSRSPSACLCLSRRYGSATGPS